MEELLGKNGGPVDRRPPTRATGLDFNGELLWCSHCRSELIDPAVEKRHVCDTCWPIVKQQWKIESTPFEVVMARLDAALGPDVFVRREYPKPIPLQRRAQ